MNYEISLKERNGVLYAHYYEGGKLFRKSLKLKATKPNIAYAQKQIIPNLQLKLAGGKKLFVKTSVSEFFERILDREQNQGDNTLNSYRVGFRRFLEYFGDRSIESFTILELDKFIAHLSKTLKPSTVKTYLTPI
ncbi:MAG TPA: hypothetical protein PKW30_05995, partial [Campylobacterales bacterium]|nr:hypothetical protein [Campylobacterales bacterium]